MKTNYGWLLESGALKSECHMEQSSETCVGIRHCLTRISAFGSVLAESRAQVLGWMQWCEDRLNVEVSMCLT